MISITSTIKIRENEVSFSFIHSSGPGGQNVNKVATAVQLFFDIKNSPSLSEETKERLIHLGGKGVTEDGKLVIKARRYRTQERNKQDAIQRLIALIRKATIKPKKRRKTKPTKSSIKKRLNTKRHQKKVKQKRRAVDPFLEN